MSTSKLRSGNCVKKKGVLRKKTAHPAQPVPLSKLDPLPLSLRAFMVCPSGATMSDLTNQPDAGLLVLAFQLPLHFQRHGVSSSPMGTMFASTPSKLPRSTRRTSHPSRLSPDVVLHVEHSQKTLLWRGLHHPTVISLLTRALCDGLASSSNHAPPWSGECAATDSHKARVRGTSPPCLPSGLHSTDARSRSVPLPRSSPVASRQGLGTHPLGLQNVRWVALFLQGSLSGEAGRQLCTQGAR